MTIVAGDILRTSCNFELGDGTLYQNIFHHKRTGVGILSDAVHVAAIAAWAEAMYAEVDDRVADDVVEMLSSVDQVEFVVDQWEVSANIGTFTISFVPTNAVDPMPNQLSPIAIFKTSRPKTVGRKFLFPFTEDGYSAGLLGAPSINAMTAWALDAVNSIELQVLDYLVPGVPRTGVDAFYEFTVGIVTNLAGTQRRRRRGYGA